VQELNSLGDGEGKDELEEVVVVDTEKYSVLEDVGIDEVLFHKDCLPHCYEKEGPCEWCGRFGMCCQHGVMEPTSGCDGKMGSPDVAMHVCTTWGGTKATKKASAHTNQPRKRRPPPEDDEIMKASEKAQKSAAAIAATPLADEVDGGLTAADANRFEPLAQFLKRQVTQGVELKQKKLTWQRDAEEKKVKAMAGTVERQKNEASSNELLLKIENEKRLQDFAAMRQNMAIMALKNLKQRMDARPSTKHEEHLAERLKNLLKRKTSDEVAMEVNIDHYGKVNSGNIKDSEKRFKFDQITQGKPFDTTDEGMASMVDELEGLP